MLYFRILCFVWAGIGIGSRIAMGLMKDNWAVWEENKAYKEQRPVWVIIMSIVGVVLIGLTWWVYITQSIPYGWILAALITITGIKIFNLVFQYDKFRVFVKTMLSSKQKMMQLNIGVIVLSVGLVFIALFLY